MTGESNDPERVWDRAIDEAYDCGWLCRAAVEDVKGRNPYRATEVLDEAVTDALSGAKQEAQRDPNACRVPDCGGQPLGWGFCYDHMTKRISAVYGRGKSDEQ